MGIKLLIFWMFLCSLVMAQTPPPAKVHIPASYLTDFEITRTSNTVLTIGSSCSSAIPCNWGFGNLNWNSVSGGQLTAPVTITVAPGFGADCRVAIYLDGSGNVDFEAQANGSCSSPNTADLSCSGGPCNIQTSGTIDAVGLLLNIWQDTTDGVWDANPISNDQRIVYNGGGVCVGHNFGGGSGSGAAYCAPFLELNDSSNGSFIWEVSRSGETVILQPSGTFITVTGTPAQYQVALFGSASTLYGSTGFFVDSTGNNVDIFGNNTVGQLIINGNSCGTTPCTSTDFLNYGNPYLPNTAGTVQMASSGSNWVWTWHTAAGTSGNIYYVLSTSTDDGITDNQMGFLSLAPTPLTDGTGVTWAIGTAPLANASLLFTTHGGSRTLNLTGMVPGGKYSLQLQQDSTGGEGLTLGTGCTWKVSGGGSGAITPSTGANAIDELDFNYDGTNCYAVLTKNFS